MPSFDISVDFDVYCARCGAGLCQQSNTESKSSYRGTSHAVNVEPCENCLRKEYDKGLDDAAE